MLNRLDKILTTQTLLILNGVIMLFGLSGGGEFLYQTGTIHIIAVFFIALSISRIRFHYYTHDQFLEKFVHACMAAILVFAFSHLVEFASDVLFKLRTDSVYANVANFYILCLLLMSFGAEQFLLLASKRKKTATNILKILMLVFIGLIFFFLTHASSISLELNHPLPYLYTVIVSASGAFALVKLSQIQDRVPFMKNVIRDLMNGIILIIFASFSNIFYEFGSFIHATDYFMINLSHYFFYAALTFMFLSFRELSEHPGLYSITQKFETRNPDETK